MSNQTFERKIQSGLKVVNDWENVELLKRARSEIPFPALSPPHNYPFIHVTSDCNIDREKSNENPTSSYQSDEFFLQNLCRWFKSIMVWINNPSCELCHGTDTKFVTTRGPLTPEEREGQADRVEVYYCPQCNAETTCFPRFNSVSKVLSTKMGRCGEYANLFGLFCRASGFETRYIIDFSDHVWVEVWSSRLHRWIMADACEGVIDTPSMYEQGWGKDSLSYILAFTTEEVTDVTQRYTRKYNTPEFQQRRKDKCQLSSDTIIAQVNATLRTNSTLPEFILEEMEKRSQGELKCLGHSSVLSSWEKHEGYHQGRISGSLDWKSSRGEIHQGFRKERMGMQMEMSVSPVQSRTNPTIVHHDKDYNLHCETDVVPSHISMRFNDDSIMPFQAQITSSLKQKIIAFQSYIEKQCMIHELYQSNDGKSPFIGFTTRSGQPIYLMTKNGYPFLHVDSEKEEKEDEVVIVDGDCHNHMDHFHDNDTWYTVHMVPNRPTNTFHSAPNLPRWSKEEQTRRISEIFHTLIGNGMDANKAGVQAIYDMLKEMTVAKIATTSANGEDENMNDETDLKNQETFCDVTRTLSNQLNKYLDLIHDSPWSFHLRRININHETFDQCIASAYRGLEFIQYVGLEMYASKDGFLAYIPVWKDIPSMKQKVFECTVLLHDNNNDSI